MTGEKLTDAELSEIKRNRPGTRASFACEGIYFTAEEEALFDEMDRDRLKGDDRIERIRQFCRAKGYL